MEIFTGQTSHVVQGDGGSNALSVSLNPVLNDRELTVPVIKSVSRSETVGKTLSTAIRATVENQDNGTLKWHFEAYEVDALGFANPCNAATCGSFAPEEGSSAAGSDNVSTGGLDNVTFRHADITFGNGEFLAVSENGHIAIRSTDGVNWSYAGTIDNSSSNIINLAFGMVNSRVVDNLTLDNSTSSGSGSADNLTSTQQQEPFYIMDFIGKVILQWDNILTHIVEA